MDVRRLFCMILSILLCFAVAGCAAPEDEPTGNPDDTLDFEDDEQEDPADLGGIVILYTNDIHNAYARNDNLGQLGYASVAAYADTLRDNGEQVVLIDGGDALVSLYNSEDIVQIMNTAGYDFAVPGNHEFDHGVNAFFEHADAAEFQYICCNFVDLRTDETVFEPYVIVDYDGVKVAYLGILTPAADENETSGIYGFCGGDDGQQLYDAVQQAIDGAVSEGADFVVAVGHMGTNPTASPWTSGEIIANTTGLCVFLDAHSHSVIEGAEIEDMDGKPVPIFSCGSQLMYLAEIRMDLNTGLASGVLIDGLSVEDAAVKALVDSIE